MRNLRIILLSVLLIGVQGLSAHVALDYPQGGESFFAGSLVNIQWHIEVPHDTENWDLYISYDGGGSYNPLILDIPVDQLSYMWSVPYIATEQARIRVVQDNIMDIDYTDYSDDFTIVVPPQDGPLFEILAQDITIECNANTDAMIEAWLEAHGGAMAIGTCGDLTWTHNFTALSDGCGNTGDTLVTFSVSDDCGINTTTARLTVMDTNAPLVGIPATDATVQCDGNGNQVQLNAWLSNHGGAAASDACGDVVWSIDGGFIEFDLECGGTGSALVTFVVHDACGNSSTTSAHFIIVDTIPPLIHTPAQDANVECDQVTALTSWLINNGNALATDACSEVSWSNNFTALSDDCGNTGTALVTFIASDACGNVSTSGARFTFHDTTAPSIVSAARDTIIDCGGNDPAPMIQGWLAIHGNAQANDNCSNVGWANDLTFIPGQCDTSFSQIVHFTITDECGNSSVTEATLELDGLTGIASLDREDLKVNVFPNPAKDRITVEFEKQPGEEIRLVLQDVLGRQVWHYDGTERQIVIPTDALAHGIYVLYMLPEAKSISKVVVRK